MGQNLMTVQGADYTPTNARLLDNHGMNSTIISQNQEEMLKFRNALREVV